MKTTESKDQIAMQAIGNWDIYVRPTGGWQYEEYMDAYMNSQSLYRSWFHKYEMAKGAAPSIKKDVEYYRGLVLQDSGKIDTKRYWYRLAHFHCAMDELNGQPHPALT